MSRPSNYRRSESKPAYHDLPQDVRNSRETNRTGKNISTIDGSPMRAGREARLSTSTSIKVPERTMKITDRITSLGKSASDDCRKDSAKLREMIENSIKDAMLSVVDQCRSQKSGDLGDARISSTKRKHERKSGKMGSGDARPKNKSTTSKHRDKELIRHRSRSFAGSRDRKKSREKSRRSMDRGKHSKRRSRSEDTGRITDNRRMTGNVNIYICSEAADGSQGQNKLADPRPSSATRGETSSFSDESADTSNREVVGTITSSSSRLESSGIDHRTDTPSSPQRSIENTGSDISSPTPRKHSDDYGKLAKPANLGNTISANKSASQDVQSAQSIANEARPEARSPGRFRSSIDRSDLSFFSPRSAAHDNGRPWTIYPSRNTGNLAASEPASLKSVCPNAVVAPPQRNRRNSDWRRSRDSQIPHKYCYTRNPKLIDRSDECRRRQCKRKFIPCPFLVGQKPPSLCTVCNKCPVQEESWNSIEHCPNCCRQSLARDTEVIVRKIERSQEEHVTSIVDYTDNVGRAEIGVVAEDTTKNLEESKSKTLEKGEIKDDRLSTPAVDPSIDVKPANGSDKDARITASGIDRHSKAPPIEDDELNRDKLNDAQDKLAEGQEARDSEGPEKNGRVPKKSETPPQPPKVESPPPNTSKPRAKLVKLAKIVERKQPATTVSNDNHEPSKPTGKQSVKKILQVRLSPVVRHKGPREDRSITRDTLGKQRKKSAEPRARNKARAMKEPVKKLSRAKKPLAAKSLVPRGKRGDVWQNKRVQPRVADGTKNMHSKQTSEESASSAQQASGPKTCKERLKNSVFGRMILKMMNRLKCRGCKAKKTGREVESSEKSSKESAVVAEEDNRASGPEKADANSQSRIRASRQDRRRVGSVVRKPAVSRPADNKKRAAATDFPAKRQKAPADKKDAPSDVTPADNPADDRAISGEKKENDPNSGRRAKPKLLATIGAKRTSLSNGQKVPRPPPPIPEEKSQEVEPTKVEGEHPKDQHPVDEPTDTEKIKVPEDESPIKQTTPEKRDSQTPKPVEPRKSSLRQDSKVPQHRLSEKGEHTVEPKMATKPARVSDAKDKVESESVEIAVPQSRVSKVDRVSVHAPADTQTPPPIHIPDTLPISAAPSVRESDDICDHSKCMHFPKSCLKQSRRSSDQPREFHDCECRTTYVCFDRRRPRFDTRCKCGGCHKREGDRRHEEAFNYGDTIGRRERTRCRRTLVCLYCDRPRDKCACRTPSRKCACCKLLDNPRKSPEPQLCQRHGNSGPTTEGNLPKPPQEFRHSKRDTVNSTIGSLEESRHYENFNHQPQEQFNQDKPNSKANLEGPRIPREDANPEAPARNSKTLIRCKCDYCLSPRDWKHRDKQNQRKSKCCYSESSVCT